MSPPTTTTTSLSCAVGREVSGHVQSSDPFTADAANDRFQPSVSFVDPRFTVLDDDTGTDDEPHGDIRRGDPFLYDVSRSGRRPGGRRTVLIVTFDEWGGFFDHVPPPRAQAANAVDPDIVSGKTLLGMRVPVVVASPGQPGILQTR